MAPATRDESHSRGRNTVVPANRRTQRVNYLLAASTPGFAGARRIYLTRPGPDRDSTEPTDHAIEVSSESPSLKDYKSFLAPSSQSPRPATSRRGDRSGHRRRRRRRREWDVGCPARLTTFGVAGRRLQTGWGARCRW